MDVASGSRSSFPTVDQMSHDSHDAERLFFSQVQVVTHFVVFGMSPGKKQCSAYGGQRIIDVIEPFRDPPFFAG